MNRIVFGITFFLLSFSLTSAPCPFKSFDKNGGALIIQDANSSQIVTQCGDVKKSYKYASTIKLLTTAAALSLLGRDYYFRTKFLFFPTTKVLTVISSGDPSMVIEQLGVVAKELKNRGVTTIDQIELIAPDWNGVIEQEQSGAGRGDRAYQAPLSPLSLNFNTVAISVIPAKKGAKPKVSMATPKSVFSIDNRAVSVAGSGNSLVISTTTKKNQTVVTIRGTIGINRKKPVVAYRRIYYPSYHYVRTLLTLMGNKMVPVEIVNKDRSVSNKGVIVYTHKSRPLHDILTDMNRYSNNFIAETVAATIGIKKSKNPKNGIAEIKKFIKKRYGFQPNIINGSGLGNGPSNLLLPTHIMTILSTEWQDKWRATDYFSTLPVYGETGTMSRAPRTASQGNIRAKTGTLSGSSAASGVFRGKNGKLYIFTLILSNSSVRRLTTTRNEILSQLTTLF